MKQFLRLAFLILIGLNYSIENSWGQAFQWVNVQDGKGHDGTMDFVMDKAGNSYAIGNYSKVRDETKIDSFNLLKPAIIKFDAMGKLLWSKPFDSGAMHHHFNLCLDKTGSIYVAGVFTYLTIEGINIRSSIYNKVDIFIAKFGNDGKLLWIKTGGSPEEDFISSIAVDNQQNIFITGQVNGDVIFGDFTDKSTAKADEISAIYAKLDANGNMIYLNRLNGTGAFTTAVKPDKKGHCYVVGSFRKNLTLQETEENISSDIYIETFISKYTNDGKLIWLKSLTSSQKSFGVVQPATLALDEMGCFYLHGTYNGTLSFMKKDILPSSGSVDQTFYSKFDKNGTHVFSKKAALDNAQFLPSFAVDSIGNIFLGGKATTTVSNVRPVSFGKNDFIIAKYDPTGNFIWAQGLKVSGLNSGALVTSVVTGPNGRIGVSGVYKGGFDIPELKVSKPVVPDFNYAAYNIDDALFLSIQDLDIAQSNTITGSIYNDLNHNCQRDATESGIPDIIVKAEPGNYYGVTDSAGNYSIEVDTGSFVVSQMPVNRKATYINQICPVKETGIPVTINKYGQVVTKVNFANQVKKCTQLTIDIAADRRRRCFRSNTTVTFANEGAADARNVQVKVVYPRYVVPISSTMPWSHQQDSLLVFTIGQLKAGEKRSFVITDSTICGNEAIRGLTQCVKASITPKNTCVAPSPNWSQASVAVMGTYQEETESATFVVENTGEGAMTDSTSYRVFANAALVQEGKTKLEKGDKITLEVPVKNQTIRVEADQVKDHPGNSRPNATVQPMMAAPDTPPTPDDAFYQDDADADVEISCLPIIDSFDPNDKQVSPIGITRRHYIKAEDELEYFIRFQNTGTDVAYKVVVVDTLSAHLDIASLSVGAASHPFTYSITGKGKPVLTFTFNNINLPDHKTNEPASHGFIKFNISQLPGNSKGTIIKNAAYNYFDYNAPVKTNEVFNIIGDTLIQAPEKIIVYKCGIDKPTIAHTEAAINLCEKDHTILTGNEPLKGKGRWRLVSGRATIINPNNYITELKDIGYGEVIVEWTIQVCELVSRSQIKIKRSPRPEPPSINEITLQCELSPQPLSAIGQNITWYADAAKTRKLHTGNQYQPTILSDKPVYYLTQTIEGCESMVRKVTVPVQPAKINFTANGDTLIAPLAGKYQWFFNGEPLRTGTTRQILARNSGFYQVQTIMQNCFAISDEQIHQVNLQQSKLIIKPNPVEQHLNLELWINTTGIVYVSVWNQLGVKVKEQEIAKPQTVLEYQLPLNNLSAGIYLLEARIDNELVRQRFVKK